MVSWESQLRSSTSTTPTSLSLSEQPRVKGKDSHMDCGTKQVGLPNRSSAESADISGSSSSSKCNGLMGVPITFLDKYNPDQFEIIGLDDHRVAWRGRGPDLNGKALYRRIIIRRKV